MGMTRRVSTYLCVLLLLVASVHALAQASSSEVFAYSQKGQAALAAGRYAEAEAAYQKLAALEPSIAEVHATLGVVYFQQRKFEQAVTELRRALTLKPGIPKADGLLAMSLSELGRYQEALPGLERTFRHSVDAPIKRMSGLQLERVYTALQLDRKAVEVALELEHNFGDDPEVLYNNERIYGNYAYITIQRLAKAAPKSVWRHQAAAEAQESQGNYVGAIAEYRTVLVLDPGRPGIHQRLGRTLLAQWHATQLIASHDEAKKEFALELEGDPNNSNASYELGEMNRQSGDLKEARAFFEMAVRAHDDFVEAHVGLANVLASQGDWAEAVPHLERAVAFRPDDQVAWYRLSRAYKSVGNTVGQKKAATTFERLHARSQDEQSSVPQDVTPQQVDGTLTP